MGRPKAKEIIANVLPKIQGREAGGGRAAQGTKDWTNRRGSFSKNNTPPSTTKPGSSAPHVYSSHENITTLAVLMAGDHVAV